MHSFYDQRKLNCDNLCANYLYFTIYTRVGLKTRIPSLKFHRTLYSLMWRMLLASITRIVSAHHMRSGLIPRHFIIRRTDSCGVPTALETRLSTGSGSAVISCVSRHSSVPNKTRYKRVWGKRRRLLAEKRNQVGTFLSVVESSAGGPRVQDPARACVFR